MRTAVRILLTTLLVMGALVVWADTPKAFAQDSQNATQPAPENQDNKQNYVYVAEPGCSLSVLTRRSLQLYDSQSGEVSLSEAQIIYAETNIVQAMGPRLLDVNERVSIDRALVEQYAKSSQTLSADSISAWSFYVARADFDVSYINPVNQQATGGSSGGTPNGQDDEGQDDATQDNQEDGNGEDGATGQGDKNGEDGAKADNEQTGVSFWIIAALGATAIYFLFGRRNQIKSSDIKTTEESRPKTKKTAKKSARKKK